MLKLDIGRMLFPALRAAPVAALCACAAGPRTDPHPPSPSSSTPSADAPAARVEASGTLVLVGTTDTHGWLLPYDYYTGRETENGLSRLAPQIDSIRDANPGRTALFDSGDLLQGTPLDFVYSRSAPGEVHPVALAMNLMRYDAAAIGNHEFNYGIDHLNEVAGQMRFPLMSANVFRAGTNEHAYEPYTLIERNVGGRPVRIGITAVTPPGVAIWDRDRVAGRLDFRDIVASVRPVIAEMRSRGADVIVVTAHSGLEGSSYDTAATHVPVENAAADMARQVPGIDVIFLGHTHRELADTTIGTTLLTQAKNWGTSIAVADVGVEMRGGRWRVTEKHGKILRPRPGADSPELRAALAEAHRRTQGYVGRRIGTSTAEWTSTDARVRDTPILDLINDVQRRVTGADLSAAAAFSLTSHIPRGPVTVADVAGIYIYDNTLKSIRISGAQLRAFLEKSAEYYLPCPGGSCPRVTSTTVPGYNFDVVSGVDYTIDLTKPVGQRITRLERNGRPVAPADSFTMAVNNYRASGSGGYSMLIGALVVYDRGESIRDLMIADIQRRGTLSSGDVFRKNWEIVPAALAERALAEQNAEAQNK
ncbi:MAG TPA: 5'-nucleotidase C-terminal domain-containing protein [Longimicrobiaceae bacterium]|jgi:2',3'-cyclic-nucleotide 2'-phosphodiesterase/3'-nucleotidase|nr:5'-nucleotidase C-terminal domain-containing protein [Longimicrobiaceae bacterium]